MEQVPTLCPGRSLCWLSTGVSSWLEFRLSGKKKTRGYFLITHFSRSVCLIQLLSGQSSKQSWASTSHRHRSRTMDSNFTGFEQKIRGILPWFFFPKSCLREWIRIPFGAGRKWAIISLPPILSFSSLLHENELEYNQVNCLIHTVAPF